MSETNADLIVDRLALLLCDDGCNPGPCADSVSESGRVLKFLANAGRLLPQGGETRTEWEVRWHIGPDDGIALHEQRLGSRRDAEVRGPQRVGQYGITRYSVHHRGHRIFEDGSSWTGPWVEVTDE
jgi:hypothetical protein